MHVNSNLFAVYDQGIPKPNGFNQFISTSIGKDRIYSVYIYIYDGRYKGLIDIYTHIEIKSFSC